MDNRQYREELIREIVTCYREVKRIEKVLAQDKYQRVFKNPKCKSAIRLARLKDTLNGDKQAIQMQLMDAWGKLPEVRCVGEDHEMGLGPLEFAAKCAKRPRRRKFMKNQLCLTP